MFAHPTTRDLPPLRDRHGASTPACMGGCCTLLEGPRLVCDTCWKHLDRRLQRAVLTWRRTTDPNVRSTVILDVEAACVQARGRAS